MKKSFSSMTLLCGFLMSACGGTSDSGLASFAPPVGTTHIANGVMKNAPDDVIILSYHTDLIACIDAAELWAIKTANEHESAGCSSMDSFKGEHEL